MIQIDVSRALAKPLARYVKPVQQNLPNMIWRADIALIGSESCIVAQEQYTQYLMVLCGLSRVQFQAFPELFRTRFCSEMLAICRQANLYDDKTLAAELSTLYDDQYYQLDPEPIEEGPITRAIEKLERQFLYDHKPLPVDGRSAFEFSFVLNRRRPKPAPSKRSGNREQPSPAEAMGNLCLNLIEDQLANAPTTESVVMSTTDNVVQVDFARSRAR